MRIFCTTLFSITLYLAAVLGLLTVLPANGFTAENSTRVNLIKVRARVERETKILTKVEAEITSLNQQIKQLEINLEALNVAIHDTNSQLLEMERQGKELHLELHETMLELQRIIAEINERMRAMYISSSHQGELWEQALENAKPEELQRIILFYTYTLQSDKALKFELDTLQDIQKFKLDEIERAHREQLDAEESLKNDQKKALALQKQLEIAIKKNSEKKERRISVLKKLQSEALTLEKTLLALVQHRVKRAQQRNSRFQMPAHEQQTPSLQDLPGLPPTLLIPVQGKVSTSFGQRRMRGFADYVLSNGVEFKTRSNSLSVRASAPGLVRYVGNLPGYELVVILGHGKSDYTLYGKLRSVVVARGDWLESGAVLGQVAEVAAGKNNFYFEVRDDSRPINPVPLLPDL